MKINYIRNWEHLEGFGITYLTGERCGHGLRILCDLSEEGKMYLENFFDCELKLDKSWNNGVGAILLPQGILTDLGVFLLLTQADCAAVGIETSGGVLGIEPEVIPQFKERNLKYTKDEDNYTTFFKEVYFNKNSINQHQMSGR